MKFRQEAIKTVVWAISTAILISAFFIFFQETEKTEISQETSLFSDPSEDIQIPQNALKVLSADLSGNIFINKTKYPINKEELNYKGNDFSKEAEKNLPLVLIIHTYSTQGYCNEGFITPTSTLKTDDEKTNVLFAGETLKKALEQKGIISIHEKTLFDQISYSGAYNLSLQAVKQHLEENPSIKFVIDIQRDALFTPKGNCIKAVSETPLGKTAQISFISGCDENGADFPNWKTNLALSLRLSDILETFGISRGVTLFPSGYGQYVCEGFVTINQGTAGNTTQEIKNASAFLAEAIFQIVFKE